MSDVSSVRVREDMYAGWLSAAVYSAAQLRLADHVADGVRGIDELAERTGTHPESLYRLMRALAGAGYFREEGDRQFGTTPVAEFLRSDNADSVKDLVLFYGREVYRAYGALSEAVRTGERAFDIEYGMPLWDYLDTVEDTGNAFRKGMGAATWSEQLPLPRTYSFAGVDTVVDVGGGTGSMLAAVLHEHPGMKGVLVEISAGIDHTMRHFKEAGVEDRVELREGSAFDELPEGDAYLISCVLHAMDDEQSIKVLRRMRDAIRPGGRVVILERIVPAGNEPGLARMLDLTMMLMNGGKERTEQEWRTLFSASGFRFNKAVAMPYFSGGAELYAIEGVPVEE
ncbi:methyltransferase [Streptomyces aurantiacus]|uniref:Putative Multifunctional cyclase-dehydratase-3-O-methyl transferase TcmN n=1 Tax=Streptomyces aurantiacus JA 4570 TaxID=1286094 RepID=S3ZK87_9ACTN|nr:methyltransferase [Streptomyces aurantiacus]EPH43986.1 putative Multifunctional cyclase-dehydratase-3-O-methyl transferase TcmN [Streptomyces aurantiacus JA 4570]